MSRWRIKQMRVSYAGRTLLEKNGKSVLSDTETESSLEMGTELVGTVSGVPYARNNGNETETVTLSISTDYDTPQSALQAQKDELDFARANAVGEMIIGGDAFDEIKMQGVLQGIEHTLALAPGNKGFRLTSAWNFAMIPV